MRVITRLTLSGPSTHVVLANRGLAARGWETMLLYGSPEPFETEIDLAEVGLPMVRVAALRRSLHPRDAVALAHLIRLMRRFRPDIVHTHHSKAGLLGRLAAAATRVPVRVHTFHGNVFEGYFSPRMSAAVIQVERAMARLSTHLVVLTEIQRSELVRLRIANAAKLAVIPLGIDLDRFGASDRETARRRLGLAQDPTVILATGRLAPIKRHDRLLRAFAAVHQREGGTRLVILGDGELRAELEQLSRALGVADAVTFAGWSREVADWYAASDIVAGTSDNEGTPLALIEAAASGRPVVATRVGGVAGVVEDGETGLLVAPTDEEALVEALVELTRDSDLRVRMGASASRRSVRFSGQRLVDDLEALYDQLLSEARPKQPVRSSLR